jgi:hypothetical protein
VPLISVAGSISHTCQHALSTNVTGNSHHQRRSFRHRAHSDENPTEDNIARGGASVTK